ncbi:ATP-binding protein [Candidatus Daviesbacteria bacterium]|nr:ATP-binding protein [Candidatus Daviesbacteria bacterium]
MATEVPPPSAVPPASPERGERRPDDYRALRIRNDFPRAIADAIQNQIGKRSSIGFPQGLTGESVGFVKVDSQSNHPLREITSRVHGNEIPTKVEPIEDQPGHNKVVEARAEFNIDTKFGLNNHTFIDTARTEQLIQFLQNAGYQTNINLTPTGNRLVEIVKNNQSFVLHVGWATADDKAGWYRAQAQTTPNPGSRRGYEADERRVMEGTDKCDVSLEIAPSSPGYVSSGAVLESTTGILGYLDKFKELSEIVATGLVQVLSGKQFPTLRMDWLPPHVVKDMDMRLSSAVEGKVDSTALVEEKVKEEIGLEKLAGLPRSTMLELMRIAADLKDPKRARFMKKHGLKQSSGAVFWGEAGTGKTLAGEAIAEEAGCERVVVKVDEYLTGYIHESARKLGEELRRIKENAAKGDKAVVIQIDEADTILRPIGSADSASARDASEIRGMLLREFQEPSNVFYILTTNLDPRDPLQADPAIVRNQRLGNLIAFGLPDIEGRETILRKETLRRDADDLRWENVDFDSLKQVTDGFSQADLQEVLSISVSLAYDPEIDGATINQQHLEHAVNIIKSRKIQEAAVREKRRMGF